MKPISPPTRPLRLLAALMLALLLLSGCRSLFGLAETFTILAGGRIQSATPFVIDGQIGAAVSLQNVSSSIIATPADTAAALADLGGSQSKLRALSPQQPATAASLISGPIAPGFYHVSGSLVIPSGQTLVLQEDGLYVFNVDGNLIVGDSAAVALSGGLKAENVVWNVGGAAAIGAAVDFNGIVVAEGNIDFGANAAMVGRLLSRTGDVTLASGEILDAATSGSFPAAVSVPQTTYNLLPGEPIVIPVTTGIPFDIGFGQAGLFVSDLPPGASHLSGDAVVDQLGPNGSDFLDLADFTDDTTPSFVTNFAWTPTVPGTYRFTYFVRSEALFDEGGDGDSPVQSAPELGALNGAIDACTITINVGFPPSTVGMVTGGGMWGMERTFQVTATSRGGRRPLLVGVFNGILARGVNLRSKSLHALVRTDLGGGRRSVALYGTASVTRYGLVPFQAVFVDGGPRSEDSVSVTLTVDPASNGGNPQLSFANSVTAGSLHIR